MQVFDDNLLGPEALTLSLNKNIITEIYDISKAIKSLGWHFMTIIFIANW
jgi:hypothetical protein